MRDLAGFGLESTRNNLVSRIFTRQKNKKNGNFDYRLHGLSNVIRIALKIKHLVASTSHKQENIDQQYLVGES